MPIHHVVNGLSLGLSLFSAASRSRRQRDTIVIQQQPSVGGATLGTAPPPYQPMADSDPNVNQYYNAVRAKTTAIAQIVLGCITCLFGVAFVVVWLHEEIRFAIPGILVGILFLSSGIVGRYASNRRRNRLIVGYLVLSIFSAVVSGIAAITCTGVALSFFSYIQISDAFDDGDSLVSTISELLIGFIGGSAIVFYIECIVAVFASALGCCGMCCTPQDDNNQMNVIQPNHSCAIDVTNGPTAMAYCQPTGLPPNPNLPVTQVQSAGPTSNVTVVI